MNTQRSKLKLADVADKPLFSTHKEYEQFCVSLYDDIKEELRQQRIARIRSVEASMSHIVY